MDESAAQRPVGTVPETGDLTGEALTAEIARASKRSAVRRWVTYFLLVTYVACALVLIAVFVTKGLTITDGEKSSLYLQIALAIFAGVSAAALSVIGYWFGNRNIAADSKLIQKQLTAGFATQQNLSTTNISADPGRTESQRIDFPVAGDKLEAAYRRAVEAFKNRLEVTGIDKGFKYVNDKRTDQVVLRVHVREKMDADKLQTDQLLPRVFHGAPLDVVEGEGNVSKVRGRPPWREPVPLLQPGLRICNAAEGQGYGTLGLIVYGVPTGGGTTDAYILSCAHVLVSGTDGVSAEILQPSPGSGQDQVIAELVLDRWIFDHRLDAALARLTGPRPVDRRIYGTQLELKSARMPVIGETLRKIGCETGDTAATVEGIGIYRVKHHLGTQLIEGFQLRPRGPQADYNISEGGDSGAVWFDPRTNSAVGLHFMGNSGFAPDAAYACFMPLVLRELDVTLVPPEAANG